MKDINLLHYKQIQEKQYQVPSERKGKKIQKEKTSQTVLVVQQSDGGGTVVKETSEDD